MKNNDLNMQAEILVVEDNMDLLFNIELILKSNKYNVLTAKNGKEALKLLSKLDRAPDIIVSDIMMPELDGYEFFKEISSDPRWNSIPFIFLSAKSSHKDIRLGKLLGVDDYITKPFDEKDLLAVISGKIARINRSRILNNELEKTIAPIGSEVVYPLNENANKALYILIAFWDDRYGPKVIDFYPPDTQIAISIDDLVNQLFSASLSIYGHGKITKSEDILLNLKNLKTDAYLLFDSYPDEKERFGEKQYMIAILASKINFFHSLEIKKLFHSLSKIIKEKGKWDLKSNWNTIYTILKSKITVLK